MDISIDNLDFRLNRSELQTAKTILPYLVGGLASIFCHLDRKTFFTQSLKMRNSTSDFAFQNPKLTISSLTYPPLASFRLFV